MLWNAIAFITQTSPITRYTTTLPSTTIRKEESTVTSYPKQNDSVVNVVLITGFESFNRDLYEEAGRLLPPECKINLKVFADSDIQTKPEQFAAAVNDSDIFIASLIFDYDDVVAVTNLLDEESSGPTSRLCFECATELMTYNHIGTFSMESNSDEPPSGPPPAVKAILNKFSSGKEEDKINGYLKLLKVGPDLLKFIPGEKASDLRTWLESYRFWNQGGLRNVSAMLQLLVSRYLLDTKQKEGLTTKQLEGLILPELEITPDVGLLHPLLEGYATNPKSCKFDMYIPCIVHAHTHRKM